MSEYKICSRCIMDTTSDPNLILDENGVCNYCHSYDENLKKIQYKRDGGKEELKSIFDKIKEEEKDKKYDCMLGISGGVDSSYLAYLAKEYGLRVLAVHVDTGWNSDIAVQNIEKICTKLNYDLHVIKVNTETMKELQRAYLFSGLANQDVPQDHACIAACDNFARKYKIKYILNGYNLATEGILSTAYQYHARDWCNIKGVYNVHGRGKKLKGYPHENFWYMYLINPLFYGVKTIHPLEYIEYSKKSAIKLLEEEFGWEYYGGKHYESLFTKFFQEIYLPERYGWYKRRDHISSLIVGGEMTRQDGLEEMERTYLSEELLNQELKYILDRLDISQEEWQSILTGPYRVADDYPTDKKLAEICVKLKKLVFFWGK